MMGLTRKCEYALRGIIYLAQQQPGKNSLLSEIAANVQVPQAFLAKILPKFVGPGLVNSFKGTGGGFTLCRAADTITLREIVEAVEGPIVPNHCLLGKGRCKRAMLCTIHPVWRKVQQRVITSLEEITLADLARNTQ